MDNDSDSPNEVEGDDRSSSTDALEEFPISLPPDSLFTVDEYLEMYRVASTETAYRILMALRANNRLSTSELAELTGKEDNDLHYYLRKLQRTALIENRRDPTTGTEQTYSYYILTDLGDIVLNHGLADGIQKLAEQETEIAERYAT